MRKDKAFEEKVSKEDETHASSQSGKNTTSRRKLSSNRRGKNKAHRAAQETRFTSRGSANDPAWYAKNPQLMKDAASLAFSNILGLPLRNLTNGIPYTDMDAYPTVPGICTLDYVTTPGIATGDSDAINVAAFNLYSYVRHMNSGHSNYEAPDLMMYIMAMDEAYKYWSHLVRIYGIARLYSQQNRYYPKAMLRALGVDVNDIIRNLCNLRGYINYTRSRLLSMCVPSIFPFIERHMWLQKRIYRDSESPKAQSYMFISTKYRTFVEATGGTPAYLATTQFPNTSMTYSDLLTVMENIINPIVGSEDFGIMSGDIKKAFGLDNVYNIEEVPEDYVVESVYDREVLSQIENAVAIGYPKADNVSELNITQVPGGGLRFNPEFKAMAGSTDNYVLNMHIDDVNPEDVMVATRFMPSIPVAGIDSNTGNFHVGSCGTELLLRIYYHSITDQNGNLQQFHLRTREPVSSNGSGVTYLTEVVRNKSAFDWSPTFYIYKATVSNPTWQDYKLITPMVDFDNYTVVSHGPLENMHNCALLSEFDVPEVGAKQSPRS